MTDQNARQSGICVHSHRRPLVAQRSYCTISSVNLHFCQKDGTGSVQATCLRDENLPQTSTSCFLRVCLHLLARARVYSLRKVRVSLSNRAGGRASERVHPAVYSLPLSLSFSPFVRSLHLPPTTCSPRVMKVTRVGVIENERTRKLHLRVHVRACVCVRKCFYGTLPAKPNSCNQVYCL